MNELIRKAIHVSVLAALAGAGLHFGVSAVALLCISLFTLFAAVRVTRVRTHAHRVPRVSYGELFLPIGVLAAAYGALPHEPVTYLYALMTLAFADTGAALIGARMTRGVYRPWGERKTYAGSGAFFLLTLGCGALLGLPLFASMVTALCATLAEAFFPRGSDNAAVPLVIVGVLHVLL